MKFIYRYENYYMIINFNFELCENPLSDRHWYVWCVCMSISKCPFTDFIYYEDNYEEKYKW